MPAQRTIDIPLATDDLVTFPNSVRGTVVFGSDRRQPTLPKILWIENAMPTQQGYRSVMTRPFITVAAPANPLPYSDRNMRYVESVTGQPGWYYTTGSGTRTHYVFREGTGWVTVATVADETSTRQVTSTFLNGETYVFNRLEGLYGFTANFAALNPYTMNGVTFALLNGITGALDYLIAYDDTTIYWSAPGSPLEFRPIVATIATGAGSLVPQAVRGLIVQVHGIAGGFLIYTTENIVSARYSGNSSNPWIFAEVKGSGGIEYFQEVVGIGASAAAHLAHTKSGLLEVTLTAANPIFPAISDFLASRTDTVSAHNGLFTLSTIAATARIISICFVSNRYFCVSYSNNGFASPTVFDGILVYDVGLKSWGRIIIPHIGKFDYQSASAGGTDTIGILAVWTTDRKVVNLRLSPQGRAVSGETALTGEIILGDLQLTASSLCQLVDILLNGDIEAAYGTTVAVRTRNSAGMQSEVSFALSPSTSNLYVNDVTGISHRIRISGSFDLSGVAAKVTQRGSI